MIFVTDPQPIAEIVPERQAELLAGLHQAEHAVTRLPTVATDRATGNLSLDDKSAQISFRRIGMERGFRPLENPQQFCLAASQSKQQFVEVAITGAQRENPIEPGLKAPGCTRIRSSLIGFQGLVKAPDEIPQGFDMPYLAGCRRHQFVQQTFGVDPAQRMGADAELSGIVGDNHRIADQTMMADGAPDAGLGKRADYFFVEDVDTIGGQILEKRNLIGKPPRLACVQPRQKGGVDLTVFQKGEGGIVENIVLIVAAQQGQKVQPRLRRRRAEGSEMFAADLCRVEIAVGMTGASVVNRDKGSRDQAGMQHGSILGMKAVQPLCQKPDDLAFGNLDTDIVQQGRQSLRRHLPMAMKHQAEATQTGAVAAP